MMIAIITATTIDTSSVTTFIMSSSNNIMLSMIAYNKMIVMHCAYKII